ncbi:Dolichyl-phosphate-mannose-protein mannosyltransferase [Singulisphaera sp. GP187]|uniref:phospholipid carrier-dependent glycosyltransferase n=1 Tax=Singulisphaera sp. GP187 TaxID=1882752 RepID=UPI000926EA76|nr:phospholipid carrier-dependent glycosyltransferase [Singulisphaera sp. GP187]SIO67552.1 Dolichyl-phosphate-mannose-protein mannosyltransferase [Singulisphaera sp. GP187]
MANSDAKVPASQRRTRPAWLGAIVIGAVATVAFAYDLPSEPSFVDEWAYLSQTYYADLWIEGATNRAEWLEYPAYDLPPLPKYLFGLSLRAGGYRRSGRVDALKWYADTRSQFGTPATLLVARWPTVLIGALGCVAVYGLGTIAFDRRVGGLAALLLMVNPLYRVHARRAMSDVIAESLIVLTACVFLWAWRRLLNGRLGPSTWLLAGAAGLAGGLAALAKLNGALAMIIVVAWTLLALVLPRIASARKGAVVVAALVAVGVSIATFIAGNPFLTAQPRGALNSQLQATARLSLGQRMRFLVDHRMGISRGQMEIFPHNALPTAFDKIATVCVQGFGRFGPFGPHESNSRIRYDPNQDWGALIWLPLVVLGAVQSAVRGRAQTKSGDAPTAWAILIQTGVALLVVTMYLPLAWDRYYLSLQPGSALLAAVAVVAVADRLFSRRAGAEGS